MQSLIDAAHSSAQDRLMGVNEIRLSQVLFGEERRVTQGFWESTYRHGMLTALDELEANGLVEKRDQSRFYLPTALGREVSIDPTPLWKQVCQSIKPTEEQEQLLRAVNLLSPKSDEEHAWLERTDNEPLITQLNWSQDRENTNLLWAISQEIYELGLIKRDARIGGKVYLTSTYKGLVWELKRRLFEKCDVFISHITDEKETAGQLKAFLIKNFGDDFKVFVSSDYRSIGGGKVWYLEIIENLMAAPVVLVLLSESSINRRWINFEAGVGIGAGNLVIPLVISGFSKGEVGPPLSSLQVRSLDDHKDVEGVLGDITGRTHRAILNSDASRFVIEGLAAGRAKLEASLHQVPDKFYDGYEEHVLRIGLVNNSTKTLDDFRLDVEVPNAFLNQSTIYDAEVENNRTATHRLFRAESKDRNINQLRPGDKASQFFITTLVIPPGLEESDTLDQKITVKVFAGDAMTQKIEMTVKEILAMPPSFS